MRTVDTGLRPEVADLKNPAHEYARHLCWCWALYVAKDLLAAPAALRPYIARAYGRSASGLLRQAAIAWAYAENALQRIRNLLLLEQSRLAVEASANRRCEADCVAPRQSLFAARATDNRDTLTSSTAQIVVGILTSRGGHHGGSTKKIGKGCRSYWSGDGNWTSVCEAARRRWR